MAVPHKLHYDLTIPLLENGIHVLVEKPMANTFSECQEMIEVVKENKVLLEVGRWEDSTSISTGKRKLFLNSGLVKSKVLLLPRGVVFSSPVASAAMFKKEESGSGVLDTGPHLVEESTYRWFGRLRELAILG